MGHASFSDEIAAISFSALRQGDQYKVAEEAEAGLGSAWSQASVSMWK